MDTTPDRAPNIPFIAEQVAKEMLVRFAAEPAQPYGLPSLGNLSKELESIEPVAIAAFANAISESLQGTRADTADRRALMAGWACVDAAMDAKFPYKVSQALHPSIGESLRSEFVGVVGELVVKYLKRNE